MRAHRFTAGVCSSCGMRREWPGASDTCGVAHVGAKSQHARNMRRRMAEKRAVARELGERIASDRKAAS
jgi:hypothetical protein